MKGHRIVAFGPGSGSFGVGSPVVIVALLGYDRDALIKSSDDFNFMIPKCHCLFAPFVQALKSSVNPQHSSGGRVKAQMLKRQTPLALFASIDQDVLRPTLKDRHVITI